MMEVLPRESLRFKTNPSSRKDSPTKILQISQRHKRIGCLTRGPKEEKMVVHQVRSHNAPNVAIGMWVNVYENK